MKGRADQIWISRAGVSGEIIERNKVLTKGARADVWICGFGSWIETAAVGIPKLSAGGGAEAGGVKGAAICAAENAEVTGSFRGGRHTGDGVSGVPLAQSLVIKKEKGFVFADGAADRSAEIVALQSGDRLAVFVVEPIVGIHHGVAEKFVNAAVKFVGPRAGYNVDQRPGGKSVFGGEVCLLDLELFHGIDGRGIEDVIEAAILIKV